MGVSRNSTVMSVGVVKALILVLASSIVLNNWSERTFAPSQFLDRGPLILRLAPFLFILGRIRIWGDTLLHSTMLGVTCCWLVRVVLFRFTILVGSMNRGYVNLGKLLDTTPSCGVLQVVAGVGVVFVLTNG